MSVTPPSVSPDSDCLSALTIMRDAGVSSLPVLEDDHLVGLVHDREILKRIPLGAEGSEATGSLFLLSIVRVAGVMSYEPPTVDDTTPLSEALRLMAASDSMTLPVLRGGRLVGVLTAANALRGALEMLRLQHTSPPPDEEEDPE